MKQTETRDLFEKSYQSKGLQSQRRYPNEQFIAFLGTNYFHMSPEERVGITFLELGCGSGANLWVVAREGFAAHGIDSAETTLNLCHQVLAGWELSAKLHLGDITALPFGDNEFDVIFDVVSTQHLTWDNHLRMWAEVCRCLKSGGRFFSYHLSENSISFKCGAPMVDHCTVSNIPDGYPLANNGNTAFLSANEVRKALARSGSHK